MWLIAVHTGCGWRSLTGATSQAHEELCQAACRAASAILREGGSAAEAVEAAVVLLEDSALTNAGFGSNLTRDGDIECEASIYCSDGSCGTVAVLQDAKNPIRVANCLRKTSLEPSADTLVMPIVLAGPGADLFAQSKSLNLGQDESLVTEESRGRLHKWAAKRARLLEDAATDAITSGAAQADNGDLPSKDTVGAVAVDMSGMAAAAASSGGILLKQSGRIGPAGSLGAGYTAVSGSGETIMKKGLCRLLSKLDDGSTLSPKLIQLTSQLADNQTVLGGLVLRIHDETEWRLLGFAHKGTLTLAWQEPAMRQPKVEGLSGRDTCVVMQYEGSA